MRRIDFDYANTCPKIDKAINTAKAEIEAFIDDLLDEACPLLGRERRQEIASDNADKLYGSLEDIFEETRRTNEDMRKEAEYQIRQLNDELADLQHQLDDATRSATA